MLYLLQCSFSILVMQVIGLFTNLSVLHWGIKYFLLVLVLTSLSCSPVFRNHFLPYLSLSSFFSAHPRRAFSHLSRPNSPFLRRLGCLLTNCTLLQLSQSGLYIYTPRKKIVLYQIGRLSMGTHLGTYALFISFE